MARMHECYGGCGRKVAREKLMCPKCWYTLPASLRAQVKRAWDRFERDPTGNLKSYEAVRDQAIEYVRNKRASTELRQDQL